MFTRDKILIEIPSYFSAFYVDKIHFVHTCDKLCRECLAGAVANVTDSGPL